MDTRRSQHGSSRSCFGGHRYSIRSKRPGYQKREPGVCPDSLLLLRRCEPWDALQPEDLLHLVREGLARGLAEADGDGRHHLRFSPSLQAIASSSTRTASSTGITGRAWNSNAGEEFPLLARGTGYYFRSKTRGYGATGCGTYGASSAVTSSPESGTPSAPTAASRCSILVAPIMGAVTASFRSSQARAIWA